LNDRIDERAEEMVTRGLKDEIKEFVGKYGIEKYESSQFASIGLKQLKPLIDENVT
jgi:tRNA A37 N6-isopentenylltransferase MiaA